MEEKKRFIHSLVFPGFFLFLIWFIKFIEFGLDTDFVALGIYPLKLKGLIGILTAPLIHANITHLFDNSIPLFFLSLALFYFYREVAYRVFFLIYFITGALVWIIGREAYHIGASGIIYGLATFLFTSGIIRRNRNLLAISLLVIFLYGSMVWGLFPYDYHISWESHLMGAITGIVLSYVYRHEGPESDIERLVDEEEEDDGEDEDEPGPTSQSGNPDPDG
ncbi:MAG TPA: rhomboid family intramembrane serine protease, partial [Bacteroidales bacterium]|nr:rhomboid family intramembrane serine protease [Bacteroidales bacterium]